MVTSYYGTLVLETSSSYRNLNLIVENMVRLSYILLVSVMIPPLQITRWYELGTKIYEDPTTLQVFTLKTGSWRTNPDFNNIKEGSDCIFRLEKQGFLLNETLHWVALLRGPEYEEGTFGIVSIGLAEEKFQVMALFPCRRSFPYSFSLLYLLQSWRLGILCLCTTNLIYGWWRNMG